MTHEILASIVIQFCGIRSQAEIVMDNSKYACTNYMINCSVDPYGRINPELVEACKKAFRKASDENRESSNYTADKEVRGLRFKLLPR